MHSSDFLQQLRHRTASYHKALEETPLSVNLMSSEVTLWDYTQYLRSLYGFIEGFERLVYPQLQGCMPHIQSRRKAHLIVEDLKMLQQDAPPLTVMPDRVFIRYYHNLQSAIGGVYVLEGSTLGGMIIRKHLARNLGDEVAGNFRFFQVYGEKTGSMWKDFLDEICNEVVNSKREEEIIDSAVATFTLLKDWMTNETQSEKGKHENMR